MILIIIATVLVLGIALFQIVQGLYSALVMAVLSILCAIVALNFYEPVAALLYKYQPGHADALALIVLFAVPLLVLRILADKFLSANIVMELWPSRIGGGALGIITAMILVGMLMISIQMLPWGPSVFGFKAFDDSLQRDQHLGPLRPDEFVVGMANFLSAGSLGTGQNWSPGNEATPKHTFANAHDDLLLELYCGRNQMLRTRKNDDGEYTTSYIGRVDTPPDALSGVSVYEPGEVVAFDDLPRGSLSDTTVAKVVIVTARISQTAKNEDGWWRLPATHFRLLTADKQGQAKSYYPVAFFENGEVSYGPAFDEEADTTPGQGMVFFEANFSDGPMLEVAWIYQIPEGSQAVRLIFRRIASQNCSRPVEGTP